MKRISILGSTGSIGTQTLDVVNLHPDRFAVVALAAGNNVDLLVEQVRRFKPKLVSLESKASADKVKSFLPPEVKVVYGDEGLIAAATHPEADLVVTAVVGSRGLTPTLAAMEAGKDIGFANKETLVTAGHLVMQKAQEKGVRLLPIDSEHSAIFQCLQGERRDDLKAIILTSSGGSFRDLDRAQLEQVTVSDALRHPTWSMGAKITIDSATMMNKGFEVIEAHWLFSIPYDAIQVLIHPESIIHSMIEFVDHSIIAQLGSPDMRVPIQYALTYPERLHNDTPSLSLAEIGSLQFRKADFERYPCLQMAYECGKQGGTLPTVLNAANEIAVERFLQGEIPFLSIERMIYHALEKHTNIALPSLEEILFADAWAREETKLLYI